MLKKGIGVTAIFVASTAIQLVSQIVVTRIFGASYDLDVFLAAVAIPTILVSVIYATVNDVLLPLYGEYRARNPKESEEYFFSILFTLLVFFGIVTIILMGLAYPLSSLFYASRGDLFVSQVATQMRFMMLSVPIALVTTAMGTYYYAHKNFLRFPIAQTVGSIVNLLLIYLLAPTLHIWALVIGFVLNILFQIACVIPQRFRLSHLKLVNISPFFVAWVPLVVGALALRSDGLLIRSFAAHLSEGYIVYLNLISKIFSLATSVLTIGVQILLLPHLVEYIAKKEYARAISTVNRAKLIAIGISVFTAIALAIVAPFFINLLFVGGKFTRADAQISIALMPYFVLPAVGWGINSVFFQPLLALKKQKELGALNVLALILAWSTGFIVEKMVNPMVAIFAGLCVLLLTGIIGSEILWQYFKTKLTK